MCGRTTRRGRSRRGGCPRASRPCRRRIRKSPRPAQHAHVRVARRATSALAAWGAADMRGVGGRYGVRREGKGGGGVRVLRMKRRRLQVASTHAHRLPKRAECEV
eukprot:6174521-Pleurochrysis_carterae.AAC.9